MDSDFKVPLARKSEDAAAVQEKGSTPEQPDQPKSSYVEPEWAVKPEDNFSFEVLKNGKIIETFKDLESKSCWSFGRLPKVNDIELAHPTISRFHAVLQYRGVSAEDDGQSTKPGSGWYLFDLGSTHGTLVNKQRIPPKTYVRLRVGYMLKMGASTRTFILLGPDHDEEDVTAESITEMKEQKQKLVEEMRLKRDQEREELEAKLRAKEEEGVSWGMAEDAEDEPDLSVNPFAVSTNEELFLDDPKKTLRGFFEREGLELEYKTEDLPNQTFQCRVELPVDDENGRPIHAQVTLKGKKKECVLQCALEACRILDRHGVLRKANQEAAVRRKKASNSDSENDDDFLDRTGDIERRRKRKTQQDSSAALTYEELLGQETDLQSRIAEIEAKIVANKSKQAKKAETDDLDDFMDNMKQEANQTVVDKVEIKKYRVEQLMLQKDLKQVQRLIQITKPLNLPTITKSEEAVGDQEQEEEPIKPKRMKVEKEMPHKSDADVELQEKEMDNVEKKERTTVKTVVDLNLKETRREPTKEAVIAQSPAKKGLQKAPNADTSSAMAMEAAEKKKARQRIRIRKQVRDNVDMEETVEEIEEKFTDWLPPTNQSGDGTTSLNDKLGY